MSAWEAITQQRSDFGRPLQLERFPVSDPVSIDSLGETWAGYMADGPDVGRLVLVTMGNFVEKSPVAEALLQSARQSLEIRHPNLLAVLEVHQEGPQIALVSEYLDGEPLSTLMRAASVHSAPLPQGVALQIVKEAIDTLAALRQEHPSTILPGALSPETIFVAHFGETMLRQPAVLGAAMGERSLRRHPASLPYRAPEHLRGSELVSERADVYSAGVILWELLAGRPLFGDEDHFRSGRTKELSDQDANEIERRCRTMEAPSLLTISRNDGAVHPALSQLVARTLRRDPEKRPRTLRELSEAIANLPGDIRADSAAVASAVDRLVGKLIVRRKRVLAEAASIPVFGSEPPSNRVTLRPDEARLTLEFPQDPHRLAELLGSTELDEVKVPALKEPTDLAQIPPAPPAVGASDIPTGILFSTFDIPDEQRKRSGGWLVAAVVCLVAGIGIGYLLLVKSTLPLDSSISAATTEPPSAHETHGASDIEETADSQSHHRADQALDGSDVDAAAQSDIRNQPADPPSADHAPTGSSKGSTSPNGHAVKSTPGQSAPPAPSQPKNPTGTQEDGTASGPFRPSGI